MVQAHLLDFVITHLHINWVFYYHLLCPKVSNHHPFFEVYILHCLMVYLRYLFDFFDLLFDLLGFLFMVLFLSWVLFIEFVQIVFYLIWEQPAIKLILLTIHKDFAFFVFYKIQLDFQKVWCSYLVPNGFNLSFFSFVN